MDRHAASGASGERDAPWRQACIPVAGSLSVGHASTGGLEIKKRAGRQQYAALPLSQQDGRLVVMLITSRETRRWVIPKGNPESDLSPRALVAKEAYEEAGLIGVAGPEPIGSYRYGKRLKNGKTVPCEVDVYPFDVERQLNDWPEREERTTRWCTPEEAAMLVEEGGLVEMLLSLDVRPMTKRPRPGMMSPA